MCGLLYYKTARKETQNVLNIPTSATAFNTYVNSMMVSKLKYLFESTNHIAGLMYTVSVCCKAFPNTHIHNYFKIREVLRKHIIGEISALV